MTTNKDRTPCKVVCLVFVMLFSLLSVMSCGINESKSSGEETADDESRAPLVMLMKTESDASDSYLFDMISGAASRSASENGGLYIVYEIMGESSEDLTDALFDAASEKPDLIICVGAMFSSPIDEVAPIYSEVDFLSIGAGSHSYKNVTTIEYSDEEAGFVAGYAAVAAGFRKLGFLGSMKVPSVINTGCGFLQGADFAAKKYGAADEVTVNYVYTESYSLSEYGRSVSELWLEEGVQLFFTTGPGPALAVSKTETDKDVSLIAFNVYENLELSADTLYIYPNYDTVLNGMISSYIKNGCEWHEETKGSCYTLDAADGIYKYSSNSQSLGSVTELCEEALSVLANGEFVPSVFEEEDSFPEIDIETVFYVE